MSYNNFAMQQPFGTGHLTLIPGAERYEHAPTNEQNDETKAKQVGLAQRPFSKEDFQVKDGRHASITNSAFGAVYARINDKAYLFCDTAGYAAFGLGYRR